MPKNNVLLDSIDSILTLGGIGLLIGVIAGILIAVATSSSQYIGSIVAGFGFVGTVVGLVAGKTIHDFAKRERLYATQRSRIPKAVRIILYIAGGILLTAWGVYKFITAGSVLPTPH